MFESFSRSWKFATTSYKVVWNNKRLLIFPLLSTLAAVLVIASFAGLLWTTGQLEQWMEAAEGEEGLGQEVGLYVTLFLFYFCNYFVIVFFNSALIASTMQALNDEDPTVEHGLAVAGKRLPQILGWALVSAFVGVVLIIVGLSSGTVPLMVLCIAAAVALFVLGAAVTSAAGTVFTALLYSYATGRTVPADVDVSEFDRAFVAKQ